MTVIMIHPDHRGILASQWLTICRVCFTSMGQLVGSWMVYHGYAIAFHWTMLYVSLYLYELEYFERCGVVRLLISNKPLYVMSLPIK